MSDVGYRFQLHQQIDHRFDPEEIKDLCHRLGVSPDDLPGEDTARELVAYAWRHNRLSELLAVLRSERPKVAWPDPPVQVQLEQLSPADRLAAMPADAVPPVNSILPSGSCLHLQPNRFFVGREDDLKQLARLLRNNRTAAVTGLGGLGKTQLAVNFAYRYGQYFAGGVFWISMENSDRVPAEVAACGGPAGMNLLPGFGDLPLEDRLGMVMRTWREDATPRLLLFDNCEDPKLLQKWRPGGGCRVLVTSRRGKWPRSLGVAVRPLGVLSQAESVELLRHHRPEADANLLSEIAEEVGYLPLALHLAGSFLETYEGELFATPEALLKRLRDPELLQSAALTGRGADHSPTEHERDVARTFAASLERLDPETDESALDLLARAACFVPGEPIPRFLLAATMTPANEEEGINEEEAALQTADALRRLMDVGLLEREQIGALRLHRLVAVYVKEALEDRMGEARTAVEDAVAAEAWRIKDAGMPALMMTLLVHLRAIVDAANNRRGEQAAHLCNTLGYHLLNAGDYEGAQTYLERALAIWEKVLGPEHPDTAISMGNLGRLLQAMGDYEAARLYSERALAIREKALGPDHFLTAVSFNNLGHLLHVMGDYRAAQTYLERALAIWEKVLGPEHPDTAISIGNLGFLLKDTGDYEEAQAYFERALAIVEKVLGPDHFLTAQSLSNLGALLNAMGDTKRARPYLERALAINEKVLGPDHPNTAKSLNNLGFSLNDMGDYEGARSYHERALAIREEVLGQDHPDTAESLNNLGFLLQAMGDYEAARPYYERAVAIREKALGLDHPDTAISLNNLGGLFSRMGDYERARSYYEQALAIFEASLGPEHPDTKLARGNLSALPPDEDAQ